jgi:cbb3-type cytochrome oxidase cytochrome c subunit
MANSNRLAREWARIGHWYCTLWHEAHCADDFRFNADAHAPPADADFIDWALTVEQDSKLFDAIISVRHAFPANRL